MPTLQVSGHAVEYFELGSGAPLVLLHCSASSGAQWRALAERLADQYRVIAPDLYGYGASAHWSGHREFRLDCEAELVLALLERAGGPAHLVGHSYGGAVALHVAAARGDLLHSLTLIEPVAFHLLRGEDPRALAEITAIAEIVARATVSGDYLAGCGRFVDYWSGPGAWAATPAVRQTAMAARLPKVVLDFHATLGEPTRLADLRSMTVPTLVLRGARSPRPTRRICELLEGVLPEAALVTLDGAGHMAPLTHREQVAAALAAQLDSNSGRTLGIPAAARARSGANVPSAARTLA